VRSFSFAATLQARKIPAANASSGALHLEESFMPKRLSNSDARCQARRREVWRLFVWADEGDF
jgi:hypothetical protein